MKALANPAVHPQKMGYLLAGAACACARTPSVDTRLGSQLLQIAARASVSLGLKRSKPHVATASLPQPRDIFLQFENSLPQE